MSPKILQVLCAVVLTGSMAHGGTTAPSALAALQARSGAFAAAEEAQDVDRAVSYWAEDAIVQAPGMPQIRGRAAIGALYRSFFGAVKELKGTVTQLTLAPGGDMAFEVGINRMVMKGPQGDLLDMGKYLTVWKKTGDTWFVVALSFTSDAAAPVPLPSVGKP